MNCGKFKKTVGYKTDNKNDPHKNKKCDQVPGCHWVVNVGCVPDDTVKSSPSGPTVSTKKPAVTTPTFTTQVNRLINIPQYFYNPHPDITPQYKDVGGGGDCQFRVFSYMLYGTPDRHAEVRTMIIDQIRKNGPCYPEWFAESEMTQQDIPRRAGDTWIDTYCNVKADPAVKGDSRAWGDHLSIQAFTDVYGIAILMLSKSGNFTIFEPRLLNDEGSPCPEISYEITEIINNAINPLTGYFEDFSRFRLLLWHDNVHYTAVTPHDLFPTSFLIDTIRSIIVGGDGDKPTTPTYQMLIDISEGNIPQIPEILEAAPDKARGISEDEEDDDEIAPGEDTEGIDKLREIRREKNIELDDLNLKIRQAEGTSVDLTKLLAENEQLRNDILILDEIIIQMESQMESLSEEEPGPPRPPPEYEDEYLFDSSGEEPPLSTSDLVIDFDDATGEEEWESWVEEPTRSEPELAASVPEFNCGDCNKGRFPDRKTCCRNAANCKWDRSKGCVKT